MAEALVKTAKPTPRTQPGHVNKHVHIPDAAWAKIAAYIEANDLREDRWLSKQFVTIAENLK